MYLNHRHQQGVSLIESMIALLVISIGLLGIAAMQITAMRMNTSALNHSQSVWIAYDMADRIRANYAQFDNYSAIDTNNTYTQDCMTSSCNSAEMITADAAAWSALIQNLPAGRGLVSSPAANELLIRVMWDDEGTGATGTACPINPNPKVDLTCYTITVF